MSVADQFLFGYDDEHRLLIGSRELSAETAVALMGATDATMSEDCPALLTGLALPQSQEYAFCVTWSAPEAPRPGAVWVHALIVDQLSLQEPYALETLIGLPQRPAEGTARLLHYGVRLSLDDAPQTPGYVAHGPPDPELLERMKDVVRAPGDAVMACDDLAEAGGAVLALWIAHWPPLRAGFSFRTREVARHGASEFDLTVARKLRGGGGAEAAPAR